MKSWFGNYASNFSGVSTEVTVLAFDDYLDIGLTDEAGRPVRVRWPFNTLQAIYEPGRDYTRVTRLGDDPAQLTIEGKQAYNYISERTAEAAKPWFRREKGKSAGRNGIVFLSIIGVLVLLYFLIVPWLASLMAGTISVEREAQIGNSLYDALGLSEQKDTSATRLVNAFFKEMHIATPYDIQITVVRGQEINAFALPGGNIVVYTALLHRLRSYPELAALLSHEFVHVNNKHSTRSIFRKLGSRVFIGLLLGKFGSVTTTIISEADELKSLGYSRSLEKESDLEGLEILKQRNIDPAGFTGLFQRLESAGGDGEVPEFLASHPEIAKRINYIQENAGGASVEENETLKIIFEKIKPKLP